ncbi:gamma-glutamylcyclotransferase family protein [Bradyrhizobium sp. HKCCYLS2038]|uniref:gamma-glutamylcyclotransferase family protein n=1 Tax=unclassified Bradyrhizobium TaxID=2631580 RepID=UPI003EB71523
MRFKYFAYGSNMCSGRLRDRVPCEFVSIAKLAGYQLRFRKRSKDQSSKCDIAYTGEEAHFVWGVVYDIPVSKKVDLDGFEGLGSGYDDLEVSVILSNGDQLTVQTYVADPQAIREGLVPYSWYKAYVQAGATEYGLPEQYIAESITPVATAEDPNRKRHAEETAKLRAWEAAIIR